MQKIGLISDVHACEDSLRAVLKNIVERGVGEIFCLGDIVGYGPDPGSCVESIRKVAKVSVLGNHDAMAVARGFPLGDLPNAISLPLVRAREELDEAQRDWLENLPLVVRGQGFEACHGSLDAPALFTHIKGRREVGRHFRSQREGVSFFGHTHMTAVYHSSPDGRLRTAKGVGQFVLSEPGIYAVGVGSVGFPRDEDPRPCWVEFAPASRTITFHRVDADHRGRDERIRTLLNRDPDQRAVF